MKNVTLAQGNQMLNLILQKQTSSEQMRWLIEFGLLSDLLEANPESGIDRNAFRQLVGLEPLNVFPVTMNYDLTVEAAVKAGKYDWTNDNITSKNFPSNRKGTAETEIILVHFNRYIESDEAIRELDKQGLRPAELPELLAFGDNYPNIQRDFPVVALGSVWRDPGGDRSVPYLYGSASRRILYLDWFDDGCYSDDRFAALRK